MPTESSLVVWEKIASSGVITLILCIAVYFMSKVLIKMMDGRIADLKERIVANEAHIVECNRDRRNLEARMAVLEHIQSGGHQ